MQQEYDFTEYFGCSCRILNNDRFSKTLKKSKASKEDYESLLKHTSVMFGSWKAKKYHDIDIFYDNDCLLMISRLRGVIFIFRNYSFDVKYNNDKLKNKLITLTKSIDEADEMYVVKDEKSIEPQNYLYLLNGIYTRIYDKEERDKMIHAKHESRRDAKQKALFKYRIGDKYMSKHNLSGNITLFEVKKTVYTVGATIINIVVMKLIYGKPFTKNTLSRTDCKTFHIKYEPGLYVFNMNHRFRKLTEEESNEIISNGYISDKVMLENKQSDKPNGIIIHNVEIKQILK